MKEKLKITYGKNGVPPLPAVRETTVRDMAETLDQRGVKYMRVRRVGGLWLVQLGPYASAMSESLDRAFSAALILLKDLRDRGAP